jgi:hypothetical protein
MNRLDDVKRFYGVLDRLERRVGGKRLLSECDSQSGWPRRGVYFFFEPDELRSESGEGPRVVRVGTHGVASGSRTTLWNRLSNHRGSKRSGGGNHRASVFRLLVGAAIAKRDRIKGVETWFAVGTAAKAGELYGMTGEQVKQAEHQLEMAVSAYIGQMSFLWVGVDDEAGVGSARVRIERNSIALLSNLSGPVGDPQSRLWLGRYSNSEKVQQSGLWNQNHVDEAYASNFLSMLATYAKATTR